MEQNQINDESKRNQTECNEGADQPLLSAVIINIERFDPATSINTSTHPHLAQVNKIWKITFNDSTEYSVMEDAPGKYKHLRIMRYDKKPIHNWMHLQVIKNKFWHEDCLAVEVYPKNSEFKNGSNQYHLWTWDGIHAPNLMELYDYCR